MHTPGLPQYLNYRGVIAPGILSLWDGAFTRCYELTGPDQAYMAHSVMAHGADQLAQDLAAFGRNGWMLEVHAVRVPTSIALALHACPDPTAALVYEERAARYAKLGPFYETRHVLVLTYLPPSHVRRQLSHFFFSDGKATQLPSRRELLRAYLEQTNQFAQQLSNHVTLTPMDDDATLHFLHHCVTGKDRPVGAPEDGQEVNYAVGATRWAPHAGHVGKLHTRIIGVLGFPRGTSPQMCDSVLRLPIALRFQHRFIFLSPREAVRELRRKQNFWIQINQYSPKRMLWTGLGRLFGENADDRKVVAQNTDADAQIDSVEREIEAIQSGAVKAGYYTANIVLHDSNVKRLEANAEQVVTEVNRLGFTAHIETDNVADAYVSSWPGHGAANVRKYLFDTQHYARLMPMSSPWRGSLQAPCPFYPAGSGPLLLTTGPGEMPFALNIHKHDLGNTLLIGPSGSGKSFCNGALAMAFQQYPGARVTIFDRDASCYVPTVACGGAFYDLETLRYAPLQYLHLEAEREWALEYVEEMARLRHYQMSPNGRADLRRAIEALGKAAVVHRTMTGLLAMLHTQERGLKEALSEYVGGILDGEPGEEQTNRWQTYDMAKLLGAGDAISTPVLLHLFHRMEQRLDGSPALTIVEESWMAAANVHLRTRTEEDSANNRKRNNAMIMVLHSPANLAAFERKALLVANTATLLFLANAGANSEGEEGLYQHYQALGLADREIQMIARELRPRRDIYLVQGENRQVFRFDSGPMEKAILAVNGRDVKPRIEALRKEHGNVWLPVWLEERGLNDLAQQWRKKKYEFLREAA